MSMLTKEQIVDLLQYIGVDKIGFWKGDKINFCCPIHGEKNPSCGINSDFITESGNHIQVFNCFSCHAKGSIPKFLYLSLPNNFKNAYQAKLFLEKRYGVSYGDSFMKNQSLIRLKRYEDFFLEDSKPRIEKPISSLAVLKSGKETYKYFFKRGFTRQDMQDYMIGRNIEDKTVTIPVFYEDGKLAGIIGRYISPDRNKNERYRVYEFNRSSIVFPLDKLKIVDDTIILTEGMFDTMMLRKWGHENACAILSNFLSKQQANIISERCSKAILLFDNDSGGETAIQSVRVRLKNRVRLLVPSYYPKEGKDVCEWGKDETEKVLDSCKDLQRLSIKRYNL